MGAKLIGWKKKKDPPDKQLVHVHNIWMREDGNKPCEPRRCAAVWLSRRNTWITHVRVWAGTRPDKMPPSSDSQSSLVAKWFNRLVQVWFENSLVGSLNIFLFLLFFDCSGKQTMARSLARVRVFDFVRRDGCVHVRTRWLSRFKSTNILTNPSCNVHAGIGSSPPHMDTLKRPRLARETHTCGGTHFLVCWGCCQIHSQASET